MLTVLVVSRPDDRALRVLSPPPPDVRLVVGWDAASFPPDVAADAEVLLVCSAPHDVVEPVFRMAPRVRWVHSLAAGVEKLLFPALVASPVPLTNGRGSFSATLAEWVMAAVLFFAKDLRRLVDAQRAARWDPFEIERVAGRTLGIVGFGSIGRAVARRARAFDMKVIAVRRGATTGPDPDADVVVGEGGLLEVLGGADDVVVSAPHTPETTGLIGRAQLEAMKPTAVLVNVGRGPVVDEAALVEALRTRRIRGAALDVYAREPLDAASPLYALDNVLLSPHTADQYDGWREEAMRVFLENLELFRAGRALRNPVDKARGY
jgi:phosphoglycerate dehydrogenase-like enzyme